MTEPRSSESGADPSLPAHSAVPEPTLAEMMSRVGRGIPFAASLAICGVAVVALAALLLVSPSRWRLALALTAAAAFGAWIVADHEIRDHELRNRGRPPGWRRLQGIAGFLGVVAVFALLLSFLAAALGLWIS